MAVEHFPFAGWTRNLRLFNNSVELIATLEVGPRIISYRTLEGRNVFKVFPEEAGKSGEKDWKIRGGHRLWTAPEDYDRKAKGQSLTYVIDNSEIEHAIEGDSTIRVKHRMKKPAQIHREIVLTLSKSGPKVTVEHLVTNEGSKPVELAPWALSVMAENGYAIIPRPKLRTHPGAFLPNQTIIVWPFADLSDERLRLGRRVTQLRQTNRQPIKLGFAHTEKWAGYVLGDNLFLKTVPFIKNAVYTDRGTNLQLFTNWDFLELETLAPFQAVAPGETVSHTEQWAVFSGVKVPDIQDEEGFMKAVERYVRQLL